MLRSEGTVWIYQMLGILLLISPFALAIIFFLSRRAARTQSPREEGGVLEFFVTSSMRLLVVLVLALLLAFTVLVAVTAMRQKEGLYALLIPITVFVLTLLLKPVPVRVDQNGIRQSRWFLPDKEIAWKDIASVAHGSNTGTTYIRSKKGGPKIRFSAFLVGRQRFKHEIRERVHDPDIFENSEDE